MATKITRTFHPKTKTAWRSWLRENHGRQPDIWLLVYKKHTGKNNISYNDAVEEGLCFGWIDSTVRTIDKDRYAQRFSPRRPNSHYSQANTERLRELIKQGKVAALAKRAFLSGLQKHPTHPSADIVTSVKRNKLAWYNWQKFSPRYRRIRLAFVQGARKRPAEFRKCLRYLMAMSAKDKQFGYGGIDKYY